MKIGSFYEFFDMIFTLLTKYCLFSVHIEPIPLCHRFSYDFSVLWLIAFTTYFQQIHPFSNVSAVQFFFDGVGNKISFIYLFHFFFFTSEYFGRNGSCVLKLVVVMYVYILSMASAVCPLEFCFSLVHFFFLSFFYYLLLLLIFLKDTTVKLYIRVFIIYPVHT